MPGRLPSGDLAVFGFCEMIALGFVLEAVSAFMHNNPWYVWTASILLGFVFFMAGIKWPKIKAIIRHGPVSLEIRPSPGEEAFRFTETAHGETHYRMEVHNGSETVLSVQVKLIKIEPPPMSEYFRARTDFPYFVRPAHLAYGNVDSATVHDINPGSSKHFELLFFWESSDHRIMVNGVDTKQELRDARFSIEERECWRMEYEISSSETSIQKPIFLVRRDAENIFMTRLSKAAVSKKNRLKALFSDWEMEPTLQNIARHLHTETEGFKNASGFPGQPTPMEKQLIDQVGGLRRQVLVLTNVIQALLITEDERISHKMKRAFRWVWEGVRKFWRTLKESTPYKVLAVVVALASLWPIIRWLFHLCKGYIVHRR